MKTSVANFLRSEIGAATSGEDLAASFQEAVVEMLLRPTIAAAHATAANTIAITGGVAANSRLRERLTQALQTEHRRVVAPAFRYCTDNAAMIAMAGSYRLLRGESDPLDLEAEASLAL